MFVFIYVFLLVRLREIELRAHVIYIYLTMSFSDLWMVLLFQWFKREVIKFYNNYLTQFFREDPDAGFGIFCFCFTRPIYCRKPRLRVEYFFADCCFDLKRFQMNAEAMAIFFPELIASCCQF